MEGQNVNKKMLFQFNLNSCGHNLSFGYCVCEISHGLLVFSHVCRSTGYTKVLFTLGVKTWDWCAVIA